MGPVSHGGRHQIAISVAVGVERYDIQNVEVRAGPVAPRGHSASAVAVVQVKRLWSQPPAARLGSPSPTAEGPATPGNCHRVVKCTGLDFVEDPRAVIEEQRIGLWAFPVPSPTARSRSPSWSASKTVSMLVR